MSAVSIFHLPYTFIPPVPADAVVVPVFNGILKALVPTFLPAAGPPSFLELPYSTPDTSSSSTKSFFDGSLDSFVMLDLAKTGAGEGRGAGLPPLPLNKHMLFF